MAVKAGLGWSVSQETAQAISREEHRHHHAEDDPGVAHLLQHAAEHEHQARRGTGRSSSP